MIEGRPGPARVAALFVGLAKGIGRLTRSELHTMNALPALVAERVPKPGVAPKWVIQGEIDEAGRLRRIYTILASRKLAAVR